MPRSTLIVRVFVALLASLALGYIWIIVSAKLEIGGAARINNGWAHCRACGHTRSARIAPE